MKRTLSFTLLLCLMLSLFAPSAFAADRKTMVIGDTTFNAENWEETIDPHRKRPSTRTAPTTAGPASATA